MIGTILDGRYRVTEVLSKGGFGHTFLAQDIRLPGDPICVVKQLKPAFSEPQLLEIAQKLFKREAEILQTLGKHSHIPQLLAYFEENSEFYLVQEYINGHTLDKEIVPVKPLVENQIIHLLLEVLEILDFVHKNNVIHRDIKPENIIRSRENKQLFLIDFGAVKQVLNNQNNPATAVGTVIGTFPYITLEVCHGKPQFCSDIYALGMIGIQAITGVKLEPYMGGGFETDIQGNIQWQNRAIVSHELAAILTKMTQQDYRQRYQTAQEVIGDLKLLQPFTDTVPDPKYSSSVPRQETNPPGYHSVATIVSDIPSQPPSQQTSKTSSFPTKILLGLGLLAAIAIPSTYLLMNSTQSTPDLPELAVDGNFTQGILTAANSCKDIPQESIFCQKYFLKGNKNENIVIEMNSDDFDPMLVILKPNGEQLELNSDIAPQNPNAKITVSLPETGNYTVIARASFAGELGKYAIKAAAE
jgi:serine/threonine-protein kinase